MKSLPVNMLEADLRVRDPDRWLSSRFVADSAQRARLVALYTLDGEWARIAGAITAPLAGEIRFAWWSETLERFADGGPAEHPALAALGREAASALRPLLEQAIDGYRTPLEDPAAPSAAKIAVVLAATRLLDPSAPEEPVRKAALAWPTTPAALPPANAELRRLPVAAFPAVAHVTLARAYATGRTPGAVEKRMRITWAALTGRL
jgi:phytoene synthase